MPIIRSTFTNERKLKEIRDKRTSGSMSMMIKKQRISNVAEFQTEEYRNGAAGLIKFCNENVNISIYPPESEVAEWHPLGDLPRWKNPETGRSYQDIWAAQQEILSEALEMRNNRFIYNLLIFCWPRGEGKSVIACLVQIWKWVCWTRQTIMLGANSKEQTKFVHYDIMRDTILNSPRLLQAIHADNVQEKEMRIRDESGNVDSYIRPVSSFSGILSNITGYTFSEIFDMKNPRFFVQIHGSIRNVVNALGVIDSTVSSKQHVLYRQYDNYVQKKTKRVFFSYRYSKSGVFTDYWNPNMTQEQLDDYRLQFPFGEFERYFLNLWEAGSIQTFSDEVMYASTILQADSAFDTDRIRQLVSERFQLRNSMEDKLQLSPSSRSLTNVVNSYNEQIAAVDKRIKYFDSIATLCDPFTKRSYKPMSVQELIKLGNLYDTDFAILTGGDFADPMASSTSQSNARTIFTAVAKGLPGSRSNPGVAFAENPRYIYILLYVADLTSHDASAVKNCIELCEFEYGTVYSFCSERYGAWDLKLYCEEKNILFEAVYPSYGLQRDGFKELFIAFVQGRFKRPSQCGVAGSKKDDIVDEEFQVFMHDPDTHWFGSPEKRDRNGVQDDCVFSINWTMYGGRNAKVEDFINFSLKNLAVFGSFIKPDKKQFAANY